MDPISEVRGGYDSYSSSHERLQEQLKPDPKRDLAFKSGFLSLQERLTNWNKQHRHKHQSGNGQHPTTPDKQHQDHRGQFATLHEFFQSKSSLRKQLEQEERMRSQRKARVPIMKLTKEDWNVRCWEERLRSVYRAGRGSGWRKGTSETDNGAANRAQKPELQVEVFNGRIDEVAKKLEKTREGAPLDEELYKLERNRLREPPREHSWTDQLKRELSQGVHDSKVLKREILERQEQSRQNKQEGEEEEEEEVVVGAGRDSACGNRNRHRRPVVLSPLGRPIGRILDDDDSDDGDD